MLHHRSFKSAKCKTALKLVVSRIKVLKNRREAHVKQLRSELAQLLLSGHHHSAIIRVEHVFIEEKRMSAYDLIEIFCELIAARLTIIESQKNCPLDLKEAISSVVFASPRCSEIPELMDVRKHIMSKYGKEFVSAAVELHADCGVNRLLVQKLSAIAPDCATKIKILNEIAEEQNIEWQINSLEENDVNSSQNLPAGANFFGKTTYQFKEITDIATNSFAAKKAGGDQAITSGSGSQEMEFRDSYNQNKNAFPMEFKDAVSAAKAAAESAERASMAARAAAELSNRENLMRQHSSEWRSSPSSSNKIPQEYAFHVAKYLSSGSEAKPSSEINRSSSGEIIKSSANSPSKTRMLESEEDAKSLNCHVHPKLPDYESFVAQLMSLKKN